MNPIEARAALDSINDVQRDLALKATYCPRMVNMSAPIISRRTKASILQTIFDKSGASAETPPVFGHFGEWVQGRLGPEGPVVLVTMLCRAHGVRARFTRGGALDLTQGEPAAVSLA